MKRWLGYLLLLLIPVTAHSVTFEQILNSITPATYEHMHTNLFVGDGMNRGFTGTLDGLVPRIPAHQHDDARDFIFDQFAEFGLDTWLDPFWFTRRYGATTYIYTNCHNVVAIQRGVATNAQWFIVGAHYDSVDPGQFSQLSPGADDNASGVAAILELARVLSGYNFRHNIVYIAFDAEEKGLKGAWHFVDTHTTNDPLLPHLIQRADVAGALSLDMLAYNPAGPNQDWVRIYGGSSSSNAPVQAALREALREWTPINVTHSGSIAGSDHHPFHERGMDACLLIEYHVWSNPHYHRTTDSIDAPDYIDYVYATELTRGVAAYLMREAEILLPPTLSIVVDGPQDLIHLKWTAQTNAVYRVESADELLPTALWHPLGTMTNTAGNADLSWEEPTGSVGQRFYRVEHLHEP